MTEALLHSCLDGVLRAEGPSWGLPVPQNAFYRQKNTSRGFWKATGSGVFISLKGILRAGEVNEDMFGISGELDHIFNHGFQRAWGIQEQNPCRLLRHHLLLASNCMSLQVHACFGICGNRSLCPPPTQIRGNILHGPQCPLLCHCSCFNRLLDKQADRRLYIEREKERGGACRNTDARVHCIKCCLMDEFVCILLVLYWEFKGWFFYCICSLSLRGCVCSITVIGFSWISLEYLVVSTF